MEPTLLACLSAYGHLYADELREVIDHYESVKNLYKTYRIKISSLPDALATRCQKSWSKSSIKEMEKMIRDTKVKIVTKSDSLYPSQLLNISDPPYVLYIHGDLEFKLETPVSIVGTRKMSPYGKRCVESIVSGLSNYPIMTVSGLALGIDALVHSVSLDSTIPTVAVLGGGLDRYEPITNSRIGERIRSSGGLIITEYPPGVRPEKHHFLERNRIIAGLSGLTIVIEGELHSGSLVTARLALSYGREVGVVPGDIFSANSCGPHSLLYDGAWPITSSSDILEILGLSNSVARSQIGSLGGFDGMFDQPVTIDQLIDNTGLSLSEVQMLLTDLEISGVVSRNHLGEYYLK